MSEIGTLINSLCHIGFIVYVLTSIAEVKKMLRNIQKREQDKAAESEGYLEIKKTELDYAKICCALQKYSEQRESEGL